MARIFSCLPIFSFLVFMVTPISAKIVDPAPLVKGNISYQSHGHAVWATDVQTKKELWKTNISMSEYRGKFDPNLEEDVQWNIISYVELKDDVLLVRTSKGETFHLNVKTGKLIQKRK